MKKILCLGNKKAIFFNSLLKDVLCQYKLIYKHEKDFHDIKSLKEFYLNQQIDILLLPNPYGNKERLDLYLKFKHDRDINYLASDRGALPNSWFFDPNGFNADSKSYHSKYWDKPLDKDREKRVLEYISNEVNSSVALELQGGKIGAENLRKKLNIDKDKKVLFVPLQRPSDTVIKYFSGNVRNMQHFLDNVVEVQEALKNEWVIVVKKHPLEVERLYSDKLLYVDDDTHFKDLIELSDAVMLINSGVGVISMMYQKPVFHFGKAFYSHPSINKEVKNSNEAIKYLRDNNFKVDFEKVKRFISYLIEDFYSFGEFVTEQRKEKDGTLRTITTKINFNKINGLPKKSKKDTLLVTDIEFWRADVGNRQRILRLIQYLNRFINLRILFLKDISKQDRLELEKFGLECIVEKISDIKITKEDLKNTKETKTKFLENFYNHEIKCKFDKYISENNFDNIIIEYIRLDYLINNLHNTYNTIIDTHDLMSLRTEAYEKNNDKHHIIISREEEYKILEKYQYIISIQKNEFKLLKENTLAKKNILVYHAVDIVNSSITNDKLTNIVFVSGPANYKHIIWFIENVWKYFIANGNMILNIHGSVCKNLQQYKNQDNIVLRGYAKDLNKIYQNADLIINPVLYGGGLKIKNVEALANGIPLITTNEGANGIEDGINYAFLLANSVDEWIEAILALKLSKKLREKLSKNAIEYAKHYFSDDKCYKKLVDVLKG